MDSFTSISSFVYPFLIYLFVSVSAIDIDFDDSRDGFFLKSPYHKFKASEPTIVREALILTHPAEVYKLRASYGPFEMYQVVPNEILNEVHKYEETFDKSETNMHRHIIHNMDVSAHLVSKTVSQSNPYVQVLVHATSLTRRQKQDLIYSYYGYTQRSCAQVIVTKGQEQFSAVCVLNGDSNACVAAVRIPDYWWDTSNSTLSGSTQVFYHLTRVEQNQECASVSNTIVPARMEALNGALEMKFISLVDLVNEPAVYDDHVDKDLVFRIPQVDLTPGTRLEVPILLEKNSALKQFVVKIRVRGGLDIEGAVAVPKSSWRILYEEGENEGTATVTAFLTEDVKYTKSFKKEEVMRWRLRVPAKPDLPSIARVAWTVDYAQNGLSRNSYFSPEETKVSVKFNILDGHEEIIVPVLKERSLLNTAVLTGKPVTNEVIVYAISSNNSFRDVTKDSSCRSLDPEALKVSTSCDHVYLDGSETRGSKNVSIVIRVFDHFAQLGVRVWVPEPKLEIQLSDPKLSQIRGWKVERGLPVKSRQKREVDLGLLTNTDIFLDKEKSYSHLKCRNKYQQSIIEVYARFMIKLPGEAPIYYRNKKTYVRVTNLVKDHLTVLNDNIAKIVGTTVQGVSPGKTEVQVISPTGKLLGVREVKVGKDKVEMERLMVRVISGMDLHISEDRQLPGALMATVHLRDILVARQQEAVLDIAVEFKDGTMLPLSEIDPSEFDLKVLSLNPEIVEVTDTISTTPSLPPSIKAMGNGKGEIVKVILKESRACARKKQRTLDTEHVHVMVDFAKDNDLPNLIQSDGYYMNNRASDRSRDDYYKKLYNKGDYFKHQNVKYQHYPLPSSAKDLKLDSKVFSSKKSYKDNDMATDTSVNSASTEEAQKEALEQPVEFNNNHMSPLEIGMYVLVAVFIFAILVFTANCAVFMVRYQRKRSPKSSQRVATGSISQAPDWVWIGRATLERHGAGDAGCNHALMAEEDFNGNQMVVPNSLSSHSSGRRQNQRPGGCQNVDNHLASSTSGVTGSSSSSGSNRNSVISTYKGSECSVRITSNPLPDEDSGMGYNEAEWDYEAMGMTYEQLMEYFDNLKESSA